MTVGEDEQLSPQFSAVCMKIFDLDNKMQQLQREDEGPSSSAPDCVQILRIFTNQFPEAKVIETNYILQIMDAGFKQFH